jgi:uncharacterized protein
MSFEGVRYLSELRISSIRLHLLEVESEPVRRKYALSDEENLQALLAFMRLEAELPTLSFDLFQDMRRTGPSTAPCGKPSTRCSSVS